MLILNLPEVLHEGALKMWLSPLTGGSGIAYSSAWPQQHREHPSELSCQRSLSNMACLPAAAAARK